ncbi:zinc-finger-containing protein [Brevundimonas sp.]|uniref:zinc-finger-containing protein n=1 Tax=Brevundimonas sp. TaxID=1871086 RepID=UPI0028B090CC|nr:zinc-finger-containing protein [Brevundimonas sp.]
MTVSDVLNEGRACIECGSQAHRLSDGREAYPHRGDLHAKPFWFCGCGAFVGCHPGTTNALGAPAGKRTKRGRTDAHKAFDRIWKSGDMTRKSAYAWLAEKLGVPAKDCHISFMDGDTAYRVVSICQERTEALRQAARQSKGAE